MNTILVDDTVRFTVICPELIRIEHASTGQFVDAPTMLAASRSGKDMDVSTSQTGGVFQLKTPRLYLEYSGDGDRPDEHNLKIQVTDSDTEWRPEMANTENLGGPLQTLDGCSEAWPLNAGLLSRNGWFFLDDSRTHILTDDWIAERPLEHSYTDWYFFGYGKDYRAALRALATLSGDVPLPRKHIFGSWYCRWWPYTSDDYRKIVQEYRENDFPLDIMVMDMDWHRKDGTTGFGWCNRGAMGWTGWSWNRDLLPDVEDLLKEFEEDNIFVTLNAHPHDGIRSNEDMYEDFMRDVGENPSEGKDLPFLAGDKRYMDAYFKHAHTPHEEIGVDFWWVDWQQDNIMPYVYHIPYLKHLPWLNHLYFEHSRERDKRGLGFSRWAGWGDHRYPIHFSGDTSACWDVLEFEIPFTVASGNSGCFFWAHDTGGFHSKERDPELYARWVQFCTFSASLRLHSCGEHLDRRPWLWGEPFVSVMRDAFHLRARLMPYVYTAAWQCHNQTVPLMRPMYLDAPDTDEAYQFPNQYFFGDHLLVAPVVKAGGGEDLKATQETWIPSGTWHHWFTGETIEGPAVVNVTTPLNQIPVWARAGAAIPMQPYTERMASAPLETLQLRCTPAGKDPVESLLYEDDGQTDGYRNGQFATTRIIQERRADGYQLLLQPTEGQYDGQLAEREVELLLHGYPKLNRGAANGQALHVQAEGEAQIIQLPKTDIRSQWTIELLV